MVRHTSITVESFAQLDEGNLGVYQYSQTFDIELGVTRFLNDSGIETYVNLTVVIKRPNRAIWWLRGTRRFRGGLSQAPLLMRILLQAA